MQIAQSNTGISHRENPGAFYVRAVVDSGFSEQARREYWDAVCLFDSCFLLARQNKLLEAQEKYEECCRVTSVMAPRSLDWLMAFYGQRLCYYHYKSRQYGVGIALTMKILESVRGLHRKGYCYLFFVEAQQQLNLSRIYFELNETDKAIGLCTQSILKIYHQAGQFETVAVFDGVREEELLQISQYGMLIEVLCETFSRIIIKLKDDPQGLEAALIYFIEPLLKLDFGLLSPNPGYKCINRFLSLMSGLAGVGELADEDILFFMNNPPVHNRMLGVLNTCIELFS